MRLPEGAANPFRSLSSALVEGRPLPEAARHFVPESELPRAPWARFGEFRLVVTDCERGDAPLSHFPPGHAGSEQVRCHFVPWLVQGRTIWGFVPVSGVRREPHGDPERKRLGSASPAPSRFWLGHRNSLARLGRASASSDWSLLIVKGGMPPFHTFPPGTRAANKFAAMLFFARSGENDLALRAGFRSAAGAARRPRAEAAGPLFRALPVSTAFRRSMPAGFRSRAIALERPLEREGWKTASAGIHPSWLGNPALRSASAVGVVGVRFRGATAFRSAFPGA